VRFFVNDARTAKLERIKLRRRAGALSPRAGAPRAAIARCSPSAEDLVDPAAIVAALDRVPLWKMHVRTLPAERHVDALPTFLRANPLHGRRFPVFIEKIRTEARRVTVAKAARLEHERATDTDRPATFADLGFLAVRVADVLERIHARVAAIPTEATWAQAVEMVTPAVVKALYRPAPAPAPGPRRVRKTVERDERGRISAVVEQVVG
jgi:hypothetical protein